MGLDQGRKSKVGYIREIQGDFFKGGTNLDPSLLGFKGGSITCLTFMVSELNEGRCARKLTFLTSLIS